MARTSAKQASVAAEDEHLQPGYDPNKAKVAELRGYLLEHDVSFPSNAKKAQLVALFKQHVQPIAQSILEGRSGVVASGTGISRIRSHKPMDELSSSSESEEEEEAPKPRRKSSKAESTPAKTKRPRSRQASIKTSESAEVNADTQDTDKPSTKRMRQVVDPEVGPKKKARATYHGSTVKDEEPIPAVPSRRKSAQARRESGFSDLNPFQSGESSPDGVEKKARRKSSLAVRPVQPEAETVPLPVKQATHLFPPAGKLKPRASSPLNPTYHEQRVASSSLESSRTIRKVASLPKLQPYVNVQDIKTAPAELVRLQRLAAEQKPLEQEDTLVETAIHDVDPVADPDPEQVVPEAPRRSPRRLSGKGTKSDSPVVAEAERRKSGQPSTRVVDLPKRSFPVTRSDQAPTTDMVRRPTIPTAIKANAFTFLTLIGLLLSYFWWRNEQLAIGYCDTNSDSNALLVSRQASRAPTATIESADLSHADDVTTVQLVNDGTTQALDWLRIAPTCLPCPSHGFCTDGQLVACSKDYVRAPSPWSVVNPFNIIPLPDRCVPDTDRMMRVAELAVAASKQLRTVRGQVVCDEPLSTPIEDVHLVEQDVQKYGLSVDVLANRLIASHVQSRLSQDVWMEYFDSALDDLVKHGEAVRDGDHISTFGADLPVACRLKRKSYEYASKRKTEISCKLCSLVRTCQVMLMCCDNPDTGLVAFAIWWIQAAIKQHDAEKKRVRELANIALRALRDQKLRSIQEGSRTIPHWPLVKMRDQLLSEEHNVAVRQKLWKKVAKIVEGNDNVRLGEAEDAEGQLERSWTWTGNVDTPLDFDSPRKQLRFAAHLPEEEVQPLYPTVPQV